MSKNKEISVEEAWEKILEKYDIVNQIEEKGIFHMKHPKLKNLKNLV